MAYGDYEMVRATDVGGVPPAWATGIVDPWTHFAMQAYRDPGLSDVQLSYIGRQIGYVNEKGEPTSGWLRAYELGLVAVVPRPLPPIDAGMPMSGVPWRRMTELERERADILPFFLPFASLGEIGWRMGEGKFTEDIQGTIKWLLLFGIIGGIIYLGWRAWKGE